jgi:hypothetical protein
VTKVPQHLWLEKDMEAVIGQRDALTPNSVVFAWEWECSRTT